MKVLFDITSVGTGYNKKSKSQSGIYRVVDNTARNLALSKQCSVSFCALNRLDLINPCLSYLDQFPESDNLTFKFSKGPFFIYFSAINTLIQSLPSKKNISSVNGKRLHHIIKIFLQKVCNKQLNFPKKWLSEFDIFHSPFCSLPAPVRTDQKISKALTIHDLSPIKHKGLWRGYPAITQILKTWSPENWAFCVSGSTRDDFCEHLNINTSQTVITPLAASPEFFYPCTDRETIGAVRREYEIPDGNYILALNTLAPHKGVDHLIRCFTRLVRQEKLNDLQLVLAGPSGWKEEKIYQAVTASGFIKKQIHLIGFVNEEHLAALYSGAMFFTFMSISEGFGLPPLEAMQCGVPVITSNTSSLPEVVGDAGIMLDPKDEDGLCSQMLNLYNNSKLREELSQKSIARAGLFSWEKTIEKTIEGYKQMLNS